MPVPRRVTTPRLEALPFTLILLVYIWLLRAWAPWPLALPIALALSSFIAHRETVESFGFSIPAFARALAAWRWRLAILGLAVAAIALLRATPPHLVYRWLVYLA